MLSLCIDAGPLESPHRTRGIGWCTHHLLGAFTPALLREHDVELTYLKRTPLETAAPGLRHARRSAIVDWTGPGGRLPPALTSRWRSFAGPIGMAADVAATGSDVCLSTDPDAVPASRRFATVAMLYDLIPLRFPAEYLPRRSLFTRANYACQLRRLRQADHLVAISDATRRDAVDLLGIDPRRISVAHLAVDRTRFRPPSPDNATSALPGRFGIDRPYLLYVGGVDSRKNVSGLISAFARVISSSDAILVIAGQAGAPGERLRQDLAGTAVADRIRWTGYVPDDELPLLYGSALALVYPTFYEGFGLPVLEAMSCGTPVLTAPNSSLPEVAGDAAIFADPASETELADGMRRLLNQPALRDELRGRGLERAARFSWTATAERVLEACRSVRRDRGNRSAPGKARHWT